VNGLREFRDRVVVVTGASSGIGAELARQLARRGARLALVARRRDRLEALAEEIRLAGGDVAVAPCDVGERSEVEAAAAQVIDRFGRIDLLVNNAGYNTHVLFKDHDIADIERMLRVNVLGNDLLDAGVATRDAPPGPRLDRELLSVAGSSANPTRRSTRRRSSPSRDSRRAWPTSSTRSASTSCACIRHSSGRRCSRPTSSPACRSA
jgi:NAD(P)-dependent dehydrogenase (short-subunit alcohol dehydrogenase family)